MATQIVVSNAPPDTPLSVMDNTPLEIAAMITDNLLEYDLAPTPNAKYSEQPTDKLKLAFDDEETLTWVTFSEESRNHILNAREASRKLFDSSFRAFAALLGDRRFRVTPVGFEDLEAISNNTALIPYITTLTFGCAALQDRGHHALSQDVESILAHLLLQDRERIRAAYQACSNWRNTALGAKATRLAAVLQKFVNLEKFRLVTRDIPTNHLGGWLEHSDAERIHPHYYLAIDEKGNASLIPTVRSQNANFTWYTHYDGEAHLCIGRAVESAKLDIQDFRTSHFLSYQYATHTQYVAGDPVHYSWPRNYMGPLMLQTMRISVEFFTHHHNGVPLDEFIRAVSNLQDLSLHIVEGRALRSMSLQELDMRRIWQRSMYDGL